MKRLAIFFAAALLLFVYSCKDEDPVDYPITGTWKPIQMVQNTVDNNNTTTNTETYIYGDCEQSGRWVFNEDKSGRLIEKKLFGTSTCIEMQNVTFNYTYEKNTGKLILDYINKSEKGAITAVTETTMNLKVEEVNAAGYISKTYSLVRVN